jgi:pimeloyl-ACP methyl ester carboxylesterase
MSYTRVDITEPASSQACTILVPDSYDEEVPTDLVLYCHGQNGPEHAPDSETGPKTVADELTGAGYFIAGSQARGNSWGSQNSVEDNVLFVKYLRETYNIRNIIVWGISMGGTVALNFARANRVNGIVGLYLIDGATNLASIYDGIYPANIDSAYGITGSAPNTYANKTAGHDPNLTDPWAWRHMPMLIIGSSGDTTVPYATNAEAFAAKMAGSSRNIQFVTVAGTHVNSNTFRPAEALAFCQDCFNNPIASARPSGTRTITLTVRDRNGNPRAGLSGLRWSWSDGITPDRREYPVDRGTAASTNGSGVLSLTVYSRLSSGGVGWLDITNSDGTTTQSPAAIAFSGPVAVT